MHIASQTKIEKSSKTEEKQKVMAEQTGKPGLPANPEVYTSAGQPKESHNDGGHKLLGTV